MITAKDLRIGNLVRKDVGCGELAIIEVIDINKDHINSDDVTHEGGTHLYWFEQEGGWGKEGSIQPIPLDKEWINKLGFYFNSIDGDYRFHGDEEICLDPNGDGSFDVEYVIQTIGTVRYVNELQNLFFALTKTELTIKK